MGMHVIQSASPEPGYRLRLVYRDGGEVVVDLMEETRAGGVFEPLRDPASFAQVRLGEQGRFVEWPCGVDLCADALWLEGQAQGRRW